MSQEAALRVISRTRNNQVAFRQKQTSAGRQYRLAQSKMTLSGRSTSQRLPAELLDHFCCEQ